MFSIFLTITNLSETFYQLALVLEILGMKKAKNNLTMSSLLDLFEFFQSC